MRNRGPTALLWFTALLVGTAACARAQEPADADELTRIRHRLQAAETNGDLGALAEIYSPDIVYQTHETAPVVGSDAVLDLWQLVLGRATLSSAYSSSEIRVSGDEAEDSGTVVIAYVMRESGEEVADSLHYELRYERSSGGVWTVGSALYSVDPDPGLRVPRLPVPTGPHRIGIIGIQAVDSSRSELSADGSSEFRTVTAQVWYPARPAASATPETYRTRAMVRAAASFLGWPIFFNSFFELVDTHSVAAAPPDQSGAPWPVILYHHGYGGFTRVHVALIEDLVSHGFVVASVGHAFESAWLESPDGKLVRFAADNPIYTGRLEEAHGERQEELKDEVVGAASVDEQERAYRALLAASPRHQESARAWAADGSFVLDRLAALSNAGGPLGGMVDLTRVGSIGHSLGGAASGQAVMEDPRVIAGVDLDGFMFGDLIDNPSGDAFMFVSAARPWAGVGGSALTLFHERAVGPTYLVLIEGFEHGTFTDLPLFTGAWPGEGEGLDGERALGIQRAYVRAFFDRHLRGADGALLDGPSPDYPEVSIRARNVRPLVFPPRFGHRTSPSDNRFLHMSNSAIASS